MNTTIARLLTDASTRLENSDSARLDAEILLCDVMQIQRSQLYSYPQQGASQAQSTRFKSLIAQRRQGHPVAYLTGKKEFWSLELTINSHTLIPRPETESLVEIALQVIPKNASWNILDIGTGSGAIALSIACERPSCNILATDIDDHALQVANQNIARHGYNNIRCQRSDWYQDIPQQHFDLIVSNPPYIAQNDHHLAGDGIRHEPKQALVAGVDGMQAIKTILQQAGTYLADGACLLLEHGHNQRPVVTRTFAQNGFKHITTGKDLANIDRYTYGYK
jgi:release factor glutamine methyltransferase